MSNRFLSIQPSNGNASHSYREGRPVVSFTIAEQEANLLPRSIRVSGRFHAYESSARGAVAGDRLSMDSKIGIWSIIDQVVLKSATSKATIEHLRHANRFYSSYFGVVNDEKTLINQYGETGLSLPSSSGQRTSVIKEGTGANSNEFCIHIPTGLLLGNNAIPLSAENGIGGLTMDIHLAPDSMVLFDNTGKPNDPAGTLTGAFYELTDLKLSCELNEPDAPPSDSGGALEYNSITGYYSTINSTNATLNFSLGLNRVSSVFMNFIPSNYLNNLAFNSLQTIMPISSDGTIADLSQVVMTKGGTRYPLDYNIDTSFKTNANKEQVDPQVVRNFMNSVLPFTKISHTLISPVNTNKNWTSTDNAVLEGGLNYGVGVAYDILGSDGADFSREAWGAQMELDLNDDNPISAFIFVHHKNTLVFKNGQVSVIS